MGLRNECSSMYVSYLCPYMRPYMWPYMRPYMSLYEALYVSAHNVPFYVLICILSGPLYEALYVLI